MAKKPFYVYEIIRINGEAGYTIETELVQGVGEHPTVIEGKYGVEVFWHVGIPSRRLFIPWSSILEVRRYHTGDKDWE